MSLRSAFPAALLVLSICASPALAGNNKNKSWKNAGAGYAQNCPPGLAKKNPPCVPPGQVRNASRDYDPHYRRGDRILGDYRIIRDVDRYGLRQGDLYYLVGREVFRISPETGRVLAFVGLADALLN